MVAGLIFDLGETLLKFDGDWEEVFATSRKSLIDYLLPLVGEFDRAAFDRRFEAAILAAQAEREEDYRERPLAEILAETLESFELGPLSDREMGRAMEVMFAPSEAHWEPVPDLEQVLNWVSASGMKRGLISNASDTANVLRLIEKAALQGYFDPVVISAAHGWRKPARPVFESVLSQWGLAPAQTVMIGDTLAADILGAQRMGMRNIWVRSAADRADNLELREQVQPEVEVDALGQVPLVLEGWLEPAS